MLSGILAISNFHPFFLAFSVNILKWLSHEMYLAFDDMLGKFYAWIGDEASFKIL